MFLILICSQLLSNFRWFLNAPHVSTHISLFFSFTLSQSFIYNIKLRDTHCILIDQPINTHMHTIFYTFVLLVSTMKVTQCIAKDLDRDRGKTWTWTRG